MNTDTAVRPLRGVTMLVVVVMVLLSLAMHDALRHNRRAIDALAKCRSR